MKQVIRNVVGTRRVTTPLVASAWIMALVVLVIVSTTNQVLADNYFFFIAHDASPWIVAGMWAVLVAVGLGLLTGLLWVARRLGPRVFDIVATATTLLTAIILVGSVIGQSGAVVPWSWQPFYSGPVRWGLLLTISLALAIVFGLIATKALIWLFFFLSPPGTQTNTKRPPIAFLVAGIGVIWLLVLAFLAASPAVATLQPFGQSLGSFTLSLLTLVIAVSFTCLARRVAGGIAALVISLAVASVPLGAASASSVKSVDLPQVTFDKSNSRPDVLWIIADELSYPAVFDTDGEVRDLLPNIAAL